jgi:hypothetical protein
LIIADVLSKCRRSNQVFVRTQAVKPGAKDGDNGDQIPNQFFFGGERFAINDGDLGSMPLAELLKPVIVKAHKPILIPNHQPLDLTSFDEFNDLMKAFALVVERRAPIGDPLVHSDPVFQTACIHFTLSS